MKLRFVRITVVFVKKVSVLNILSVFLDFVMKHANPMRRVILSSVTCQPLPYVLHYFKYSAFSKKLNWEGASCFFAKFVSNISYFKKNWRCIRINKWITFVKCRTCKISKGLDFIPQFLRNILILIFLTFLWVESELLQTERLTWRGKYFNFVKLRTRLKLWLVFLMSFHRTCM